MTSKEQLRILNTYGDVIVANIDGRWWAALTRNDGMHTAVRTAISKNLAITGLYEAVAEELRLETAEDLFIPS